MSWDILVQDMPDVSSVADVPDGFTPQVIGERSQIIASIKKCVPAANFNDPSCGVIDDEKFSIGIDLGTELQVLSFMLYVGGDISSLEIVAQIINCVKLKAIDINSGEFFTVDRASNSFGEWARFRDRVSDQDRILP